MSASKKLKQKSRILLPFKINFENSQVCYANVSLKNNFNSKKIAFFEEKRYLALLFLKRIDGGKIRKIECGL